MTIYVKTDSQGFITAHGGGISGDPLAIAFPGAEPGGPFPVGYRVINLLNRPELTDPNGATIATQIYTVPAATASPVAPVTQAAHVALTAPGTAAAVDLATAEALANACKADLAALGASLQASPTGPMSPV